MKKLNRLQIRRLLIQEVKRTTRLLNESMMPIPDDTMQEILTIIAEKPFVAISVGPKLYSAGKDCMSSSDPVSCFSKKVEPILRESYDDDMVARIMKIIAEAPTKARY